MLRLVSTLGADRVLTLRRFKFWSVRSTKLGKPFKRAPPILSQNDTSKLHGK